MLNKFEQKADWKAPHFGLKYSLNNKTKQQVRNLAVDYGVMVEDLASDSALAKSFGLKAGDLILAVDGQSLLDGDFSELMDSKIQGQKVDLTVLRAGKKLELKGNL
jgi:C-terminal processing protease CtpA/Prc